MPPELQFLRIVGENYRTSHCQKILRDSQSGDIVTLTWETTNQYDKNSHRVLMTESGHTYHVGYIDRNQAARIVDHFQKYGYTSKCSLKGALRRDNPGGYPEITIIEMVDSVSQAIDDMDKKSKPGKRQLYKPYDSADPYYPGGPWF